MPNYDKLHVPVQLVFCAKPQAVQAELMHVLTAAKQGDILGAQDRFDQLVQTQQGLGKCADFWVFVVRFFVISRDIQSAVDNLQKAFKHQAQPNTLLVATQSSLTELQKKIQKTETPKNMVQLQQIAQDVFSQSAALSKPPRSARPNPEDMKRYMAEKEMQRYYEDEPQLQISQVLHKIE